MSGKVFIQICATTLLVAFFMPWFSIMGGDVSGFDIPRLVNRWLPGNEEVYIIFAIPALSVITLMLSFNRNYQLAYIFSLIAGLVTLSLITYVIYYIVYDLGGGEISRNFLEFFIETLGIGAWLTLISGFFLLFLGISRHK